MRQKSRFLVVVLVGAILLWSAPAQAVLKKVVVTDTNGEPVADTEITIFNDEGEEIGKKKTDKSGILIFDYPDKGKTYQLSWDGGTHEVQLPRVSKTTWILAGVAAVGGTAGLVAATGGGDDYTGAHTPNHPSIADIPGHYTLNANLTTNTCGANWHQTITQSGIPISASGQTVTVHSSADVRGPYNPTSGAFEGVGTFINSQGEWQEVYKGFFYQPVEFRGTLTFTNPAQSCTTSYDATLRKN